MTTETAIAVDSQESVPPAFICGHLFRQYQEQSAPLVYYFGEADEEDPDDTGEVCVWCQDCDDALMRNGGVWDDKTEAFADIKMVCGCCLDKMLAGNIAGNPEAEPVSLTTQ